MFLHYFLTRPTFDLMVCLQPFGLDIISSNKRLEISYWRVASCPCRVLRSTERLRTVPVLQRRRQLTYVPVYMYVLDGKSIR